MPQCFAVRDAAIPTHVVTQHGLSHVLDGCILAPPGEYDLTIRARWRRWLSLCTCLLVVAQTMIFYSSTVSDSKQSKTGYRPRRLSLALSSIQAVCVKGRRLRSTGKIHATFGYFFSYENASLHWSLTFAMSMSFTASAFRHDL